MTIEMQFCLIYNSNSEVGIQLSYIYTKETIKMQDTMEQEIGISAGQIYNYLAENEGQSTFTKLKKDLDLKSNFAELGLGWLAREEKVELAKSGNSLKIRLR